ncbi:hypothetical protein ACFL5K_03520 [Gemmatimonadota bacterium]
MNIILCAQFNKSISGIRAMRIKQIAITTIIILFSFNISTFSQSNQRIIHVFVALCDNEHQGIVPVSARIGNGEDPGNNLYWGAKYGLKTFFTNSSNWTLLKIIENPADEILERCIFKHNNSNTYLLADAYRGKEIKQATIDFLNSASCGKIDSVSIDLDRVPVSFKFGRATNLLAYVGHNGLMDF